MESRIIDSLNRIRESGNYRQLRRVTPLSATRILHEGREFLNLCSNSYLSLHAHPAVVGAAREALEEFGAGTCSSRSVSGSLSIYSKLEEEIAAYKGYPGSLIFSNGYMANIGIIATLTDESDVIFSDELNHSSIIDSTRLSRSRKVVYRHLDMDDLEQKLRKEEVRGKRVIITETVFSMDGDIAPLDRIWSLKKEYDAHVIVDEAHATGVFGEKGKGVEEVFGLSGMMDVQMGTFGKALGSYGAFALSGEIILEYLVNRARTFMYTTALPAPSLAAAQAALRLVREDASIRSDLWTNIRYLRIRLKEAGFDLRQSQGPIIPIVVGEDRKTVAMQRMLHSKGMFLQGIRPPTVPEGTSRLRLTVVREFTKADMDEAVDAITTAGKEARII